MLKIDSFGFLLHFLRDMVDDSDNRMLKRVVGNLKDFRRGIDFLIQARQELDV